MNSTALIVIIFLVIAAIVSTAIGRWKENHTDDAAWGHLPDDARDRNQTWERSRDDARGRNRTRGRLHDNADHRNQEREHTRDERQAKQISRRNRGAKWKTERDLQKNIRTFDTGVTPDSRHGAAGPIIFIVILIIIAAVIFPLARSLTNGSSGKKSSRRPKTSEAEAALSSLESQMRDLFSDVETDSDYPDTLGYIVNGYISDGDDHYYRPYVEIILSEEGVITTIEYTYVFPVIDNMEDKEQAVSDMEDVLQSMYDKVSQIQGNLASDHLKDYPDISENVRNGLLTVKSDSAEDSIQDSFTYDDGCQMQCEEFGGRSLYLEFWKYN